jgi:ornithine carbamoyltransferase
VRFGFTLRLACPEELSPPRRLLAWAQQEGGRVSLTSEPAEAVADADCVVTDTWISMGVEASVNRHNLLAPYRVDEQLMALAKPDAIFMHCLPATRGQEVTGGVIDGPQSAVWDEAENRLHAQKGILAWCLG